MSNKTFIGALIVFVVLVGGFWIYRTLILPRQTTDTVSNQLQNAATSTPSTPGTVTPGSSTTDAQGNGVNTNPGQKTFVYPGTDIEIGKHNEVTIPNTQKYFSAYNPANPNDTQTLYLIDADTNSIKVVGKLSGNESYAAYPLHSTATIAPYYIEVFFPSGPDVPYGSVASIRVFDTTKVGEEDTRNPIRSEQIKL